MERADFVRNNRWCSYFTSSIPCARANPGKKEYVGFISREITLSQIVWLKLPATSLLSGLRVYGCIFQQKKRWVQIDSYLEKLSESEKAESRLPRKEIVIQRKLTRSWSFCQFSQCEARIRYFICHKKCLFPLLRRVRAATNGEPLVYGERKIDRGMKVAQGKDVSPLQLTRSSR